MKSLEDLMSRSSFDVITVGDICENCDLSRTAFYKHFRDKYELLERIYQRDVEPLVDKIGNDENYTWVDMLHEALEIIDSSRSFYRNALKNAQGQNSLAGASAQFDTECALSIIDRRDPGFRNDDEKMFALKSYILGYRTLCDRIAMTDAELDHDKLVGYMLVSMPEVVREALL